MLKFLGMFSLWYIVTCDDVRCSCAVQLMGDNKALMVGYLQREPGFSSKFIVLQINTKVAAGLGK
jgi:hypothetical protein